METLCTPKSIFLITNCIPTSNSTPNSPNSSKPLFPFPKKIPPLFQPKSYKPLKPQSLPNSKNPQFHSFLNPHLCFLSLSLSFPLPTFASELTLPIDQQLPTKINLEEIVVSIDEFITKYPFFVAGVTFTVYFVIPVFQLLVLSKYKFITALDAFKKLRDDPNAQLLDIRDRRSLKALGSPSLRTYKKKVLQAEFNEGDEDEFVKKVLENFPDPANTEVCVLDNFDGDSYKVAALLVNNGFKKAYAISDGVRGNDGWLKLQEADLLPLSVYMYPPKKVRKSKELEKNGAVKSQTQDIDQSSSEARSKQTDNGHVNMSIEATTVTKNGSRSSSPFPKYPDMKPPSSPTPSEPQN